MTGEQNPSLYILSIVRGGVVNNPHVAGQIANVLLKTCTAPRNSGDRNH